MKYKIFKKNITTISTILALCFSVHTTTAWAVDYKNWEVECDNLKNCSAFGFPADDVDVGGYIRVDRLAGPNGAVEIKIFLQHPDKKPLKTEAKLSVDGKAVQGVESNRKATSTDEDQTTYLLAPEEIKAFISALRSGHELQLSLTSEQIRALISLDGGIAALLKMDDVQGRIGTVTALIRTGPGPSSSVPEPPEMPTLTARRVSSAQKADAALATQLRAYLHYSGKAKDCDDLDENKLKDEDSVYVLSDTQTLVGVACMMGAYQGSSQYWIIENQDVKNATAVVFDNPMLDPKNPSPSNELTEADFDPETATIGFFAKGRGMADCGVYGSYIWTGKKFLLANLSFMSQCYGILPGSWPVIWESKVM